jgi:hypothetical protein
MLGHFSLLYYESPGQICPYYKAHLATILPRFAYRLSVLYSVFVTSLAAKFVSTLEKRNKRYTWRWVRV